MAKVTGLGGAFLRADDPPALYAWYERHLGLGSSVGCFLFPADAQRAYIAVSFFPRASDYFPVSQPAMLNFQVDDLRRRAGPAGGRRGCGRSEARNT